MGDLIQVHTAKDPKHIRLYYIALKLKALGDWIERDSAQSVILDDQMEIQTGRALLIADLTNEIQAIARELELSK